jgi:hypothetical protein
VISGNLKRDLYFKVFKKELIRELYYLWDVANGRAAPRDAFTDQMIKGLSLAASSVPFSTVVYLI